MPRPPKSSFSSFSHRFPTRGWSCIFAALLASGTLGAAEQQIVALEIVPNAIQFPVDGTEVKVTAILRNPTGEGCGKVKIRSMVVPGVTIEPETDKEIEVAPYADAAVSLKITRIPGVPIPASVNVIAEYDRLPEKGKTSPKIATAPLTLTRPEIETSEAVVTAEVITDLETLHSGDEGTINIVLTNSSQISVCAKIHVHWPNPNSLDDKVPHPKDATILPRSKAVIQVPIKALNRVQVGKQTVEFTIRLYWGKGADYQQRTIHASKQFSLDVFAESSVLDLLGKVPLLLFLPGVLTLMTWALLWRVKVFRTRYDTQEFPLELQKVDFFLVAILISFVLLGLHQLCGFDYTRAYGFHDLVVLYLLSVGLYGVVPYSLVIGGRWVYLRRRIPTPADTPIEILKRLGRRGLGLNLWCYDRGTENAKRVFLLEPPAAKEVRPTTWIAPAIELKWIVSAADEVRKKIDSLLKEQINLGENANTTRVAALINEAVACKKAERKWVTSGGISQPIEVNTEDTRPGANRQLILETQEAE